MKMSFKTLGAVALLFILQSFQAQAPQYDWCGTPIPDQQWEEKLQDLIREYSKNPSSKSQSLAYTIPVIIHVIHGGEAVGTYPNLAQGQLNSQIQVLNNDYGGIGLNTGAYP